ncbi:MAG: hypothetical protein HY361_04430 [Candidatus Aenigmarchaeota archaeon]|nr:hypothetical protein [Candidatus Aenigmarchaeota archaeon]
MKKIPSKDKVSKAIKDILSTHLKLESQEDLARHAVKLLKKEDKNYTLSPIRVKRIALDIPEIEVKAKTKKTVKLQDIKNCPVCESDIRPLTVKNLLNKNIAIGYRCTSCSYQSDLEAFMPMRYIFILKSH